jgi:CRP-like cAMP-binding protein
MIVTMVGLCFFAAIMDAIDTGPGLPGAAKWGVAGLDILVLLNVTSFWWRGDEPPYLRPKQIAGRLNVNVRSVQRALKKLEKKGLIRRGRWRNSAAKTAPLSSSTGWWRG